MKDYTWFNIVDEREEHDSLVTTIKIPEGFHPQNVADCLKDGFSMYPAGDADIEEAKRIIQPEISKE